MKNDGRLSFLTDSFSLSEENLNIAKKICM